MARFVAVLFAAAIVLGAYPAAAQMMGREGKGPATTDAEDTGYARDETDGELYPVEWTPVVARCDTCKNLADGYNDTLKTLLYTRFWLRYIGDEEERLANYEAIYPPLRTTNNYALDLGENTEAFAGVSYSLSLLGLSANKPALQAQEESLDMLASAIAAELTFCERNYCSAKDQPFGPFLRTNLYNNPDNLLPYSWQGPYHAMCSSCSPDAARLNGLPDLTLAALARLEKDRAYIIFTQLDIISLQVKGSKILLAQPDDPRSSAEKMEQWKAHEELSEVETARLDKILAAYEDAIATAEAELDKLANDFSQIAGSYSQCLSECGYDAPAQLPVSLPPAPSRQAQDLAPVEGESL